MKLHHLSEEILIRIALDLSLKDVFSISQVNKTLKSKIYINEIFWRQKITQFFVMDFISELLLTFHRIYTDEKLSKHFRSRINQIFDNQT